MALQILFLTILVVIVTDLLRKILNELKIANERAKEQSPDV
jgi:hypothetical protein